jgi:hypothetical protein
MVRPLDYWNLSLSDTNMYITGLAKDVSQRDQMYSALARLATSSDVTINRNITAGPAVLSAAEVQTTLDRLGTCGALAQAQHPNESYAVFDTITVTGDLANDGDQDAIKTALIPLIGDRTLRVDPTILNDNLCAIRDILPPVSANNLSIWLGDGATGKANPTGIFTTGQNPVVEVQMPASIEEGYLWVMVVDNTGKVFHILPNINHPDYEIKGLGTVQNGLRQVRVLNSIDDFKADGALLAMTVNKGDYGKSEIVAILTRNELFDLRRPRDENITSVAESLAEAFADGKVGVLGVARRLIDARP